MREQTKRHRVSHIRIWVVLESGDGADGAYIPTVSEREAEGSQHFRLLLMLEQRQQCLHRAVVPGFVRRAHLPKHVSSDALLPRLLALAKLARALEDITCPAQLKGADCLPFDIFVQIVKRDIEQMISD